LVYRLQDAGALDVRDDIRSWLTRLYLEGEEPIHVEDILAHMGGLNIDSIPGIPFGSSERCTVLQRLLGEGAYERVRVMPGAPRTWQYSGGGYALLEVALEDLLQKSYFALLQEHVLRPLRMYQTHHAPGDDWAVGHDESGQPLSGGFDRYPELSAAGLWTTASDLVTMYSAASVPGFLSAESCHALVKPRVGNHAIAGSVSGSLRHRQVWHGGSNHGYRSLVHGYLGEPRAAAVVAATSSRTVNPEEVLVAAVAAAGWRDFDLGE
jgi:CubicO group peptidase (beta-lactamase class C family)